MPASRVLLSAQVDHPPQKSACGNDIVLGPEKLATDPNDTLDLLSFPVQLEILNTSLRGRITSAI